MAAALQERHPAALAGDTDPAVLEAALAAVDAQGYTKVRLADVARHVGTTAAELRRTFPTRHHLIAAAVVATAPDRYADAIAELTNGDDTPSPAGHDASTRDRLLAAALDVLDTAGYRGARIVDIAHRAHMTTGAVYKNFGSKHELLDAAMAKRYSDLYRSALALGAGRPGGLLAAVAAALDQHAELDHRALVELFAIAGLAHDAGAPLLHELTRRHRDIADLVDEANAEGNITPDVPTDGLAHVVQLLAIGNIVTQAIGARHATTDQPQTTLRHLADGLAAPPPPTPES